MLRLDGASLGSPCVRLSVDERTARTYEGGEGATSRYDVCPDVRVLGFLFLLTEAVAKFNHLG